jgi:hypothetical protein
LGSKKSQLKNKKIRKTPPPIRRIGEASSIARLAVSDPLNETPNTSSGPKLGIVAHIIKKGKTPLTTNTAKKKPQVKKKRLAFCPIPERTSALITALSIEVIISKRDRPKIVRNIKIISITLEANRYLLIPLFFYNFV